MARPPKQPPKTAFPDPDEAESYEALVSRYRPSPDTPWDEVEINEYFGALLNSPPFAAALGRLGTLVRTAGDREGTYSHLDREFVDQVLAPYLGTNVVMRGHIPDALDLGMPIESIEALRADRDEDLSSDEQLLATYIRQVVDGTVADETWDAMERRLGVRGLVEYTIFVAFLQLIMRLYQAFGLEDPSNEEIDRILDDFRDGRRTPPDYRLRIR